MLENLILKLNRLYEKTELVVKALALVLIIIFFVPTTIVSCDVASFSMEISPFDMAIGNLDYESDNEYNEEIDSYLEDTEIHIELFLIPVFAILIFVHGTNTPVRSMLYSFLNIILILLMHHTYIEEPILSMEIGTFLSIRTTFAYDLFLWINILFLIFFGSYLLLTIAGIIYTLLNNRCECGAKLKLSEKYCPKCGKAVNGKTEGSPGSEKYEGSNDENTVHKEEQHTDIQK